MVFLIRKFIGIRVVIRDNFWTEGGPVGVIEPGIRNPVTLLLQLLITGV